MSLFDPAATNVSYCVSTLNRLRMIQDVIKQTELLASTTRKKLELVLESTTSYRDVEHISDKLNMRIRLLKEEISLRKEAISRLNGLKDDTEALLSDKANEMSSNFQRIKKDRENYLEKKRRLEEEKEKLLRTRTQLQLRRKQLISEITNIYPIVPHPQIQEDLMICGVHLPDSEKFANREDQAISVALGYVCHVLVILSKILDVPLRYAVIFSGSRSFVYDHLNVDLTEADKMLPLFSRKSGRDKVYFNYAVYLLNHVIAQLQHHISHPPKNLSRTLPNLHSLIMKFSFNEGDETRCPHNEESGEQARLTPIGN